ncbi:hypothetical protein [Rhodococcus koreensis]
MVLHSALHVDWVAEAIAYLDAWRRRHRGHPGAVAEWVDECRAIAEGTLILAANSWCLGANIPGRPRVCMPYLGGFSTCREIITGVAESGYEGFVLLDAAPR